MPRSTPTTHPLLFFFLILSLLSLRARADPSPTTHICSTAEDRSKCWNLFWAQEELQDREKLLDWSFFNYSSYEPFARMSIVECNEKTYDVMSFKGGHNDSYALAFYLSTEVAVSAAQNRSGHLFDVAVVEGDASYRALMSQIQLDLKGNRSKYYAKTRFAPSDITWPSYSSYRSYFARLYRFLRYGPPSPVPITDATPIFRNILQSLQTATESSLGVKMNTSEGFYKQGKKYMYLDSPFELNWTYASQMRTAMDSLNMSQHYGYYSTIQRPSYEWYDHANDVVDYSGAEGTRMAFDEARREVEMNEYEYGYRHGDFVCGTPFVEKYEREKAEMIKNGTWVEPPQKEEVEWDCESWAECWRAYPSQDEEWWIPFP